MRVNNQDNLRVYWDITGLHPSEHAGLLASFPRQLLYIHSGTT